MSLVSNTTSSFETIFNAALANYTKQTGKDLRNHPLASKIDSSDGPDSILDIFQEQAQAFEEFRRGDTKLFKLLRPVVNVLHALSTEDVLRHSVSHVSPTMLLINHSQCLNALSPRRFRTRSQFSPLSGYFYPCVSPSLSPPHSLSQSKLQTAKYVRASYDALVDIFECTENFLNRLTIYTKISPTPDMTEMVTKIMVELLSVLALATKQINQGRFSTMFILVYNHSSLTRNREVRKEIVGRKGNRISAAKTR